MKTVGDGDFTVCIVRLSPFNDIERSSPHIFLYHECRAVLPAASIDFAWFPTARERQLHEGDRDGWLTSVFTKRPLAQFDLLLISNAYALELVNLPYLLTRAGIALSASERRQAGFKPLIVLGGSNSLAAQSVTFSDKDALVDAIHFGEGETLVSALVETLKTRPGAERRTGRTCCFGRRFGGIHKHQSPQPGYKGRLPIDGPLSNQMCQRPTVVRF